MKDKYLVICSDAALSARRLGSQLFDIVDYSFFINSMCYTKTQPNTTSWDFIQYYFYLTSNVDSIQV